MCGAVSIQYDPALREELAKFFSENEIRKFEQNGEIVLDMPPIKRTVGLACFG